MKARFKNKKTFDVLHFVPGKTTVIIKKNRKSFIKTLENS